MKHTIDTPKYLQETETFTSNNIVEVGTAVTIDSNGVASGYTTSSYLKYNTGVAFNPSDGSDFEVNIAFKLPTGATGGILIGTDNNRFHYDAQYGNFYYYAGIRPTITRNSLTVELFDETKNAVLSYSRCEKFYTASISYTFDTTTTYVVNIKKSGTSYTTTLTDINNSFTQTYTDTSNKIVNQYNRLIGANLYTEGGTSTAFDGEIDLFNSWIKKNGNLWWTNKDVIHAGLVPQPHTIYTPKYLKKVVIEEAWTQPILSANGTMGGNSFAVSASSNTSGYQPWKAFDNNNSTAWEMNGHSGWLKFYNPIPIRVINLNIKNYQVDWVLTGGIIQGSNDDINYVDIKNFTNSVINTAWNIDLSSNTDFYKYYKIVVTNSAYGTYTNIAEIIITATQQAVGYTAGTAQDYNVIIPQKHTINTPKYLKKVVTETAWNMPTLSGYTTNTTDGVISVTESSRYSSYYSWYLFNNDSNQWYNYSGTYTGFVQIKFPYYLKITGLSFTATNLDGTVTFYTSSDKTTQIGDILSYTANQANTNVQNINSSGVITDTLYADFTASNAVAGKFIGITATKYSETWQAGTENDYTIIM